MFEYIYNSLCMCNIFSDCSKIQNEPGYKKIIANQEQSYNQCDIYRADPLWQDRRMLSFPPLRTKGGFA